MGHAYQNGVLFVIGALGAESAHGNKIEVFNDKGLRIELTDFHLKIEKPCATFVPGNDDEVYFMGGHTSEHALNNVWRFKLLENWYNEITTFPDGFRKHEHSCAGIITAGGEKAITVVSGWTHAPTQFMSEAVQIYKIDLDEWEDLPSLPSGPRMQAKLVFWNKKLFLFGGWGADYENVAGDVLSLVVSANDAEWVIVGTGKCPGRDAIIVPYSK